MFEIYNETESDDHLKKKRTKSPSHFTLAPMKEKKTALVLEGGAMRGVFSAGVLHAFGRENFDPFRLYIGVSAGACNLASHLAGQNTRNFDIIKKYTATRNCISLKKFLAGGHLVDLDWLWEITIREYRLDLKKIFSQREREYIVVATSMKTGEPLYLEPDEESLEHCLKVSSSLPVAYRNILRIKDEPASDGGIADSLPVREAWRRGAERIVVIRTRRSGYVKQTGAVDRIYSWLFREYPQFRKAILKRAENYMKSVEFIRNPPPGIEIIEIAPPGGFDTGRLTTDINILESGYRLGIEAGLKSVGRI